MFHIIQQFSAEESEMPHKIPPSVYLFLVWDLEKIPIFTSELWHFLIYYLLMYSSDTRYLNY